MTHLRPPTFTPREDGPKASPSSIPHFSPLPSDATVTALHERILKLEVQLKDEQAYCIDLRERIDSIKVDYPEIVERFSEGRRRNQAFGRREERIRRVAEQLFVRAYLSGETHHGQADAKEAIKLAECFEAMWEARSSPPPVVIRSGRENPDGGELMDRVGP